MGVGHEYERRKLILLSVCFFLIIGAYTLVKELKDSVFISTVGKAYIPWAKMLSMIVLIPAVLFYSLLVDKVRRYQLLYIYSLFYGVMGFYCTYLIGHPTIGIGNTDTSPSRIFGWLFYFLIEGYAPFMVSVFWAFLNSINDPKQAKSNYGLLASASKLGGIFAGGGAWYFLSRDVVTGLHRYSDVMSHQIVLTIASLIVLSSGLAVYYLMRVIPGAHLHGYEAVYQFEKKRKEDDKGVQLFSGLRMLVRWPYILGIFGMVFFYEVVTAVLGYHRLGIAQSLATDMSDISCELFRQAFIMHVVGFIISITGTGMFLRLFGERVSLLVVPLSTGLLLTYLMFNYTADSLILVLILLRSINYAFAVPVRESLYIPTVKEMKFKSKSWIDAFGSKVAKGMGSSFNVITEALGPSLFLTFHGVFFACIVGLWTVTAVLLGNRFAKAVADNEVIGSSEQEGL